MCIRDRERVEQGGARIKIRLVKGANLAMEKVEASMHGWAPVSYTHLDVYKRQVYVGKVEQVYPNHHYVLIALAGNVYEPGTVLISQSPGREEKCRVANLIVTEERMGRARIPADIRSGAVQTGGEVPACMSESKVDGIDLSGTVMIEANVM